MEAAFFVCLSYCGGRGNVVKYSSVIKIRFGEREENICFFSMFATVTRLMIPIA